MKKIVCLLKSIILSFSIIYTFDVVLQGANVLIPINIPNLLIGMFLGPFGITTLIVVYFIIK